MKKLILLAVVFLSACNPSQRLLDAVYIKNLDNKVGSNIGKLDTLPQLHKVTISGADTLFEKCVIPSNIEEICKRSFDFVYDNGVTPGSSSNTGGQRPNFLSFNWTFTSLGWETGAGVVGVGDAIGSYTGWGDQLNTSTIPLSWSAYGTTYDPYNSVNAFNFYGAPTWRGWSVTGCDPNAKYGVWTLLRDDGVTYTVYPVLYTETIEKVYRSHEIDCDGNPLTRYWDLNADGKTYTEIETPDDIDCFVSCDFVFEPVIIEGSESPCTSREWDLCDEDGIKYKRIVTDCADGRTRETYTLDSYINAVDPDDLVEGPTGALLDCNTGEAFVEPQQECSDFEIITLYQKTNVTDGVMNSEYETGEPTFSNANWGNTAMAAGIMDAMDITTATVLTAPSIITGTFQLNDTENSGSIQDIQYREGFIIVENPFYINWSTASEGSLRFELGLCKGDLVEQFTEAKGVGTASTPTTLIPSGIHYFKFTNLDAAGSNSSYNASVSYDGITYVTDNTPDGVTFSATCPQETCVSVKVCKDSGEFINLLTGEVLDASELSTCKIECVPIVSTCVTICKEPCDDFASDTTTETRLADCTVSNMDTLLTLVTVCNNDVITNDTTATYTEVKEDCLIDGESWKLAASDIATTGVTGYASGHYTTDCPLWSEDVHKSATVSWSDASALFMFGMSDDQAGTWTGDMIFYVYKWSNGTTLRNWLRAYSDTGGWLTGWLDQGATATTSDICIERSGTVETWYVNGVSAATSVGTTNPLYCWSSPYTAATGTWSEGTHLFTDVTMCPTKCDGSSTRIQSTWTELSNDEAIKILTSDGITDIDLIMNPDGVSQLFLDINECLIDHSLSTNKSFAVADLRAFAEDQLGFTDEQLKLTEPNLIKEMQKYY